MMSAEFNYMETELGDIAMSTIATESADNVVDSSNDFTADGTLSLDGEAEPEGCGLDPQTADDHTYNQAPLSYELQQGLRILKELMSDSNKSVNWHFLNPVDDSHPETADYYEKIKNPIWLGKMKEKFDNREYETITQFVADFRQMLENCYRFNGPDHFVSRRAQKLETMMEQKLNLLSRDLREKTSISATSGHQQDDNFPVIPGVRRRSKAVVPHDSTVLLNQLRVEEIQKEREARRQQVMERKAVLDAHIQGMMEWEDKLMADQREELKAMWELPSVGLLLFLCHYPFNIGEVSQFELERCLFMPRESSTLQRVMTTLLSTPFQRQRLDKIGLMPYRVWNEKLRDKMAPWFKLLKDSQDPYKVADKFGIDPFLFQVVGKKNPLKKKFHELTLYKKVWVLKSLVDHCVESQESLVKSIESQCPEEQKEYKLGEDEHGNTYLHFPQFCGADVRIYRRAYIPEPEFDEPEVEEEEEPPPRSARKRKSKKKEKTRDRSKSKEKTPVPKKKPKVQKTFTSEIPTPPTYRPSRLRQTIKTVLPVTANDDYSTDEDEFESTEEDDTQSESESKSESEDQEGITDSGTDNNTPFKNILRNQILDLSEASSVDSDFLYIRQTRSGRIRFNGAMRMNNDISFGNENSCDIDSTLSENSNTGHNNYGKVGRPSHTDFKNVKLNNLSDIESNSEMCHKNVDEKGDGSSPSTPCCELISKNKNSHLEDRNLGEKETDNISKNGLDFSRDDKSETTIFTQEINEDSSTSNDFSEFDGQMSVLDVNTSDNSSQNNSDIMTISRIFEDKSESKIFENDSDTNSSFHMKLDSFISDYSAKSDSPKPSDSICKVEECSVKDEKIDINEGNVRKITPYKDVRDEQDTDTEFDEEVEMDNINDVKIYGDVSFEKFMKEDKENLILKKSKESFSDSVVKTENLEVKTEPIDTPGKEIVTQISGDIKMEHEMKEEEEDTSIVKQEPEDVNDMIDDHEFKEKLKESELTEIKEEIKEESVPMEEIKQESELDENIKKESELPEKVKEESELTEEIKEELELTEEMKEESDEEEDDTELVTGPEIGSFELVAENVEDIRTLVEKFAESESYMVGRGKKARVVKPPQRKRCVIQLHDRLDYLLKELEPWEQKLIQATKKARLKMKKEYEDYDEKEVNGWESDHSESTNSATEYTGVEQEPTSKPRMPSVPKDISQNEDSRTSEDFGEWDISLRGRIRKRRIIPNNVEDQGLSKKRKVDTTQPATAHLPNILAHGKNVQSSASMVSLVTSNAGQVIGQKPGHLLLHTSGGQTYYTGINQQGLNSLRMLSQNKQSAHPIIQQLLRQPGMAAPRPLANTTTAPVSSNSKLVKKGAAVPQKPPASTAKGSQPPGKVQYFAANINSLPPAVIQQLIKSNALSIQAGNNQQGMILLTAVNPGESGSNPGAKATLTLQNPVPVKISTSSQQTTVSSIQSTAVTTSVSSSSLSSAKLTGTLVSKDKLAGSILSGIQVEQNSNKKIQIPQTVVVSSKGQVHQQSVTTTAVSKIVPNVISTAQQPILSNVQASTNNQQKQQCVPISVPKTTAPKIVIPQNTATLPLQNQGMRLQNVAGVNLLNTGGYIINTGQNNQGVAMQLNPSLNIGGQGTINIGGQNTVNISGQATLNVGAQGNLNIGGQGLTLQQIQALAMQGINLQGVALQGSNLIVQPNVGLRIQNPGNIQSAQMMGSTVLPSAQTTTNLSHLNSIALPSQVVQQKVNSSPTDPALKGFLNSASCSISGICPPISPVISSVQSNLSPGVETGSQGNELVSSVLGVPISPGKQQCKYASNVTVKTLLEARKPSFTETLPENHGTIVVQSTATGIKKLKLPSKAALDSAIQTVVTEVKTSLPTANIKVPFPVTMPTIQPRRNITKTIQSMKVPIPTTPKVMAKSSGLLSVQISPPNSAQPASPAIGQPNVALPSPLQSGILNFNQLNNGQLMLTNLKSNTNVPTGQNVVQGYLTPQGLIIPSANLKNLQTVQKIGNSNVAVNVSTSVEPASQLLINSPQNNIQTVVSSVSNSTDTKSAVQNSRDLKHLQSVQDLRNIAAINANLVQQLGSQQYTQKPLGINLSGNQLQTGNFVYLSPSANVQPGAQFLLSASQPSAAPVDTNAKAVTVSVSNNNSNLLAKPIISLPLGTVKAEPAKSTIISLPLAPITMSNTDSSLSLPKKPEHAGIRSVAATQPQMVNTFASNATLLSRLNSPVLTTCRSLGETNKNGNGISHLASVSHTLSEQNKSFNIQESVSAQPVKQSVLQKPLMANQHTKQAPIILNQQGSSSEIIKQLAAAQVLGATVQQNSSLNLPGGNKLVMQVPGQVGQLQTNALPVCSNTPLLSPVLSATQTNSNTSIQDQQKSTQGSLLTDKVMIQVPGQSQTMLFISPQKQILLGSPGLPKSNVNNLSQGVPQQLQTVRQIGTQSSTVTAKTQAVLQSNISKAEKQIEFPFEVGQSENIFKFPAAAGNNSGQTVQQSIGVSQQNTQTKATTVMVPPSNNSSIGSVNAVPAVKSVSNLQAAVSPTPTKQNINQGTPQKLFLYNINGQLVTAQGVPVTVDNGILKILPQPKVQMSNFTLPKSPPANSKPTHGNVPISPKPGQATVNTQQAYLNVLTSTNSSGMISQSNKHPVKGPQLHSPVVGQSTSAVRSVGNPRLVTGVGLNSAKSVARNLNMNLNAVANGSNSANNNVKPAVHNSVNIGENSKPSHKFVVMPETGGQTQIVFPQPNVHSNHLSKTLTNNLQNHMKHSSVVNQTVRGPSINTSVIRHSFAQSSPITVNHSNISNSSQNYSNSIATSSSYANHHSNVNGQNSVNVKSSVQNNGKQTVNSTGDAEEAALNLLSLANQRFAS